MKSRYKLIADAVLEYYPNLRSINILDCGCGRGEVLQLLDWEGFKPLGIDDDPVKISLCIKEGLNVAQASVTKLPVQSKTIDVLICSEVLEHLEEEECFNTFCEFDRVLKEDGLLIITTPEKEKDIIKDPKHKKLVTLSNIGSAFFDIDKKIYLEVLKNVIIYKNQKCKEEDSGNLFLVLRRSYV